MTKVVKISNSKSLNDLPNEIWRDIEGFEGLYKISSLGRVKSLSRIIIRSNGWPKTIKEKIKAHSTSEGGYWKVQLTSIDGKVIYPKIHRLLAIAFIPNPEKKEQVNHINGIKTDNRLENLEWATRQENGLHAFRLGLKTRHNKSTLLTIEKANEIRSYLNLGVMQKDLASMFNVSISIISSIKMGVTWRDDVNAYGGK